MTKTLDIKLMIIENFIDYFTSDDIERETLKEIASSYVDEDHIDEITCAFHIHQDGLGVHTICQNCGASTNL